MLLQQQPLSWQTGEKHKKNIFKVRLEESAASRGPYPPSNSSQPDGNLNHTSAGVTRHHTLRKQPQAAWNTEPCPLREESTFGELPLQPFPPWTFSTQHTPCYLRRRLHFASGIEPALNTVFDGSIMIFVSTLLHSLWAPFSISGKKDRVPVKPDRTGSTVVTNGSLRPKTGTVN